MKNPPTPPPTKTTRSTTKPIINPALLFEAGATWTGVTFGNGGAVTLGCCWIVTLETMSADSTRVAPDIFGSAAMIGFGVSTFGAAVDEETLLGTAVADASNPITVGALTSEFVCRSETVDIVCASSPTPGLKPPCAAVSKPALSSLAKTAVV